MLPRLAAVLLVLAAQAHCALSQASHGAHLQPRKQVVDLGEGVIAPFGEPLLLVVLSGAPPSDFFANITDYLSLEVMMIDTPQIASASYLLPTELGMFCNLQFAVARRVFYGTLPTELGRLTKLRQLDLAQSQLVGTIPSQLGLLPLVGLFLTENQLEGTLPTQLGNMPLGFFRAQDNRLGGTIPSQLFSLRSPFHNLDLDEGQFEGPLPSQLWRAVNLTQLILTGHRLSGTLPPQVGRFGQLRRLDLARTSIGGPLPSQLGLLTDLGDVALDGARFSGTVPSEMGMMRGLRRLQLHTNMLSGPLPSQLGLMHGLTLLELHDNSLSGTIPRELFEGLTNLRIVSIGNNSFEGDVPEQYRGVWLQDCDFSGLVLPGCEVRCSSCSWRELEILQCDSEGNPPVCFPLYSVVVATVGLAGLVVVVVVRLNPDLSRGAIVMTALSALHSTADVLTDVLFAVGASEAIQVLSLATMFVMVVSAVVWTAWILRTTEETTSPVRIAATCFVGVFSTSSLQSVVHSPRACALATQETILLTITEGVVQSALQATSLANGSNSTVTWLAFAFSVSTIVALSAVLSIIRLSQRGLPRARKSGKVSVSAVVEMLVLGDAPGGAGELRADVATSSNGQNDDNNPGAGEGGGGEGRKEEEEEEGGEQVEEVTHKAPVRKRLVLGALCCCVVAVLSSRADHGASVTTRDNAQALVRASALSIQEDRRFSLEPAGNPTTGGPWQKAAECTEASFEYVSVDLPVVFLLNTPVVLLFIASTDAQIRSYIVQNAQTVRLLASSDMEAIPSEIGLLTQLLYYGADGGRGRIPSQLGLLTELATFTHGNSDLEGPLPSELVQLSNLRQFLLSGSLINGTLPSQLGLLTSLAQFSLRRTQITGTIPSELALPSLDSLILTDNSGLRGSLPSQFFALDRLQRITIRTPPSLVVRIGPDLGRLGSLSTFAVSDMQVEGTLPRATDGWGAMQLFSVQRCDLEGPLVVQPSWAGSLTSLDLPGNRLSGSLPSELGLLTALLTLHLNINQLSGTLPSQLGLLTGLQSLRLSDNHLSGTVPSQLGLLTALSSVSISNNALEGGLPDTIPAELVAVWVESCDDSGVVVGKSCARQCPGCSFGGVQLKGCNGDGFDNVCLPLWGLLLLSLVGVGAVGLAVKKISTRRLTTRSLVVLTLVSGTNALHWLVDVAFAVDSTGVTRVASLCVVFLSLLARFVLSTSEFVRMQQLGRHTDITSRHVVFALAILFCVLNPFTLRVATSRPGADSARERRSLKLRLVLLVVASDVPQLCLQAVRLADAATRLVTLAVVMTSCSLAIAAFELRRALAKPATSPLQATHSSIES